MARIRTHEVASELVANVLSLGVGVGDKVAVGDEMVLLESMKMEIPVLSDVDGTIAEIRVTVGDVVQDGSVLVVLNPS